MAVNHITRRFVHQLFLKPLDIAAIEDAKRGLIDFVAVTHCGKDDPGVHKLLQLADAGTSKVIGHSIYTSPEQAALINGFMAHALDFDDVHHELRGHPSAVLLPTLFALCDENTTGIRLIQAYAIGVEAMAKLALALSNVHYEKGWHNTSTIGIVGAAIAGAYLIGLTVDDTCRTIGFATTMASGMRVHFGTETKPLHAGIAAKHAIEAIRFAQVGMHVNDNSLEGYIGFLSLYGENTPKKAEALLLDVTSATWRISSPGLWFKLYPCCSGSYFGIDAALQIGPITAEKIEEIHITFSHYSDAALVIREPKTCEEGRFSIEYIVSLILANRPLHLASFLPEPIDSTLQQYMKKVKRSNDLEAVSKYTQIDIRLTDGTQLSARGINPKGSPSNPLTTAELESKLASVTEQADTIIAAIRALNGSKVSSLLQLL
ncbi:MmgE/PrpD family protein [Lysinibacillus sp. FSL K6-0232]|uniref:MmgE/PrpD family protein n=1 Tax=unclassified Lysinibacillus TaxID=2636778 RepID=UPI0030F59A9C